MTPPATHPLCDRARSWAALAPDEELSELERELLRAHLAACRSCRRFAVNVGEIASVLRTAPSAPLSRPVASPKRRRRRPLATLGTLGAAAAVASMALGIASSGQLVNSDRKPAQLPRNAGLPEHQAELQLLRSELRRAPAPAFVPRDAKHFGERLA